MEFPYILRILAWTLAGVIVVTDGAILPSRPHEQGHNDVVDSTAIYPTSVTTGHRISSVSPANYNYTIPRVANVSAETISSSHRNIAGGPSSTNRFGNASTSNTHLYRPLVPTIALATPLAQTNNAGLANEEQDDNTRGYNSSALSRGDVIAIASCIGTFVSIVVAVLALWIARQTLKTAAESATAAAALAGRSFLRKFLVLPPK